MRIKVRINIEKEYITIQKILCSFVMPIREKLSSAFVENSI